MCRQTSKRNEDKRSKNAICNMGIPFVSSEEICTFSFVLSSANVQKVGIGKEKSDVGNRDWNV